ncbi:HK97 family phage prohead protease [Methylobacterium sp. NMS14P]|uniref:HK97 family phage prohead protease n=1 Tax=Methylobacterium sp. NMS14P TaxID=2894310 RepID=UPI002358BFCC|nr:HK97 family phage prohead protease [Methylobacterium sp. NMS14P]WCS27797.1 HK97 family phage prohead protease [Methylobacterium sp. NMS14P]
MASKRVSIDEYLGSRGYGGVERKHFARDSGVIIKAAPSGLSKAGYDKVARTMRFVMSAEIEDRDRDIVVQAGLNTTEFEKNPVAPWSHRAGDPPVGTWSELEKSLGGRPKRTEGTLTLVKGDVMADRLDVHFEAGSIRACSIGFMPLSIERREVPEDQQGSYFYPGYMIHEADLYECSPCCVPANPAALAKAAAAGDVLARELIEEVLDTWSIEKGLLVPRKAFEASHRQATGERTTVTFQGKTFAVEAGEGGAPALVPVKPSKAERVIDALETDEGLLNRLAKALGFKGRTDAADPKPGEGGTKPAPEPTPEQKLRDQFAADLPALTAKHEILDADARLAGLDSEMGQHAPA